MIAWKLENGSLGFQLANGNIIICVCIKDGIADEIVNEVARMNKEYHSIANKLATEIGNKK